MPIKLKRKVYKKCIVPLTTFGKHKDKELLMMLKILLRDKIRNEDMRKKIKILDIIKRLLESKWRWVDNVVRQNRNKCRPRETKRGVG